MTTLNRLEIASDTIRARGISEICNLLEREEARPVLVSVWTIDRWTGRPVCRWTAEAVVSAPHRGAAEIPAR
jgi:hypothetical protein